MSRLINNIFILIMASLAPTWPALIVTQGGAGGAKPAATLVSGMVPHRDKTGTRGGAKKTPAHKSWLFQELRAAAIFKRRGRDSNP